MIGSDSVAVVVSAYNPDDALISNVLSVKNDVTQVVVVDDGSPNDTTEIYRQLEGHGVVVIRLTENSGIAAALNTGIRHAISTSTPSWVMTMDQDSRCDLGYVAAALNTFESSLSPESVGSISASTHNGIPLPLLGDSNEPEVFDPMQSGTLIRTQVLKQIGMLDEELFIDCVDSEFNARLRKFRFRALAGKGCNLLHSLGEARPMKFLGWHVRIGNKKLFVHYHAPFRVYYITRNSITLARMYFKNQPQWVLRRIFLEVQSNVVRFVYGPNRWKHAIAASHGAFDAVRRKMGKIDPDLAKRIR